jgi:F-type H+-transporting ATPase subunit epsilon
MTDKIIHLEIVTPEKIIFNDDVKSFTAPGTIGSFQILPNHAPFISSLQPGKVKLVTKDGHERLYATSGGVVEVHANKISMLAETIEAKHKIDVKRARSAKERAMKKIETARGDEVEIAKVALLRALNRLRVAGYED